MDKIRFVNDKGREVFLNPKLAGNPSFLQRMKLTRDEIKTPDAKPPTKEKEEAPKETEITTLEDTKIKYKEVFNKKPHHSWDLDKLNEKINAELKKD